MKSQTAEYDILVAGGGLAGFSAAVAAARHGSRVALVQDRPVLGGNSSSEVRVTPHGAAAFHAYARETGIISEVLTEDRAKNHAIIRENGWTNSVWDMILYDLAMRTPNLTLYLNTSVYDAEVADERIVAAVARVANAELIIRFTAGIFIDCTGDGVLADLAGAESRIGLEAASEYDESHAPKTAQDGAMGSSLHFKTVDAGKPVEFVAPSWAVRYDDPSFFSDGGRLIPTLESGYWWIEIGAPWDTLHDNEQIRHELTRHVLGIWDYLKNRDPYWSPRATNLALDWVGQVPGKRESRRILGKYFMTESDLIAEQPFDDEIAFGGWYVDLHTIGGLLKKVAEPVTTARLTDPATSEGSSQYVGPFGIPLRALVSKDLENLLMAGRNVSATHVALSSIRVMGTTALMGQAAGTAAALVPSHNLDLRSATSELVNDVQQALLRDGCFLPSSSNEDPDDLARSASVSTSSEEAVSGVGPGTAARLGGMDQWRGYPVYPFRGELKNRTAQWIAVDGATSLDTLSIALSNANGIPTEVQATLYSVDHIWDYRVTPGKPLSQTTLSVPPGGPHWVRWELNLSSDQLSGPGYVRVDLAPVEGVEWALSPRVLPGQVAAYQDSAERYRRFGGGSTLSFRVDPPQHPYIASNVISGSTRPHRTVNQWRSDPGDPLPQWIQLDWEREQIISQIQITFAGNLLREYHAYPPFFRDPQCARDYRLEKWSQHGWEVVQEVRANYSNRVVHDVEEMNTTKLRLVITSTNGDDSAGIYEIRCYDGRKCTPTYETR